MIRTTPKLTPGHLALILGLGVNPVAMKAITKSGFAQPLSSLTVQLSKNPTTVAIRWQSNRQSYCQVIENGQGNKACLI